MEEGWAGTLIHRKLTKCRLPGFRGRVGGWLLRRLVTRERAFLKRSENHLFADLLGKWHDHFMLSFLTYRSGGNVMRAWVWSKSDLSLNPACLYFVGFGVSVSPKMESATSSGPEGQG